MSPRPLGDKRVAHGGASRTSWGVCPAGLERRWEGEAALGTSGSSGSQGQWCWGRLLSILPRELALDRSVVLSLTLLLIDSDLPQTGVVMFQFVLLFWQHSGLNRLIYFVVLMIVPFSVMWF